MHPLIASYHYLAIITSFKSLFLIFGNFEPVLHWSRWVLSVVSVVEAVEEASIPGLYPVEVLLVLIDICQRLNFRSFEPVLHWSRWVEAVDAVAAVAQNVHSRSSCSGSTTSDSRYSLNFRTIEPVLHSSRWVEEEKLLPLSLLWVLESIYCQSRKDLFGSSLSGWIEFQDYWAGLALKSLCAQFGSVQSRHICSDITTRNQSAVELISHSIKISRHLSRSYTQVAVCGSVQSRYVSSCMTTRNQSVVELIHSLIAVEFLNFRTFEPVLHSSRWVWKRPI